MKSLSDKNIADIKNKFNIKDNGTVFLIIDENEIALEFIGRVRLLVAEKLDLIDKNKLAFLWVNDFPMFEKKLNKIDSKHNPFTAPKDLSNLDFNQIDIKDEKKLLKIISNSYDIVLNGFEIGGGAIRISDRETQIKVFEILGFSKSEIALNFDWFLEAQNYGIPNHGGIAIGIDRLLSILLNKESIRDVIAFPKTSHGTDDMTKSPIVLK